MKLPIYYKKLMNIYCCRLKEITESSSLTSVLLFTAMEPNSDHFTHQIVAKQQNSSGNKRFLFYKIDYSSLSTRPVAKKHKTGQKDIIYSAPIHFANYITVIISMQINKFSVLTQ
jgi:hypothetical protein